MWSFIKVLDNAESEYNGTIQAVSTLEGNRIIAGGISQSGPLVAKVWNAALKKVKKDKEGISKVLVLGLGGGSAASLVNKYWPTARITGVEIDPIMIDFGKRYLGLDKVMNLTIVQEDVNDWMKKLKSDRYQLILIDLYTGSIIPEEFTFEKFLERVSRFLDTEGVAAFNHLYSAIEKEGAHTLERRLLNVFTRVTSVKPEANIIYICNP